MAAVEVAVNILGRAGVNTWVAEASELRWAPGRWPQYVRVTGVETLSTTVMLRHARTEENGALHVYEGSGFVLSVWND